MGYPNLAREEAKNMAKKSERSLLLWCMLFAFACLLLSGGGRLIASEDEPLIPARPAASIRAVLCNAPASLRQTGTVVLKSAALKRLQAEPAPDHREADHSVISDANGNVLLGRTYIRAVYQAFTLDDGFV